jgi:hypothetical protein
MFCLPPKSISFVRHPTSHPSSHKAARIAAGVYFCLDPERACGKSSRTAHQHGSSQKRISTRIRMKATMSSKFLRTRSSPGALAFSLNGRSFRPLNKQTP